MSTLTARLNAALRTDPTRTLTLRRQYERDMVRRYRRIMREIRKLVADEDGLGLRTTKTAPAANRFEFLRDPAKVSEFMIWLEELVRQEVLETVRGAPIRTAGARTWQDIYLLSAYQKGLARAGTRLRSAGADVRASWIDAAFFRPVHADRAGLVFVRAFDELKGITSVMSSAISRELSLGLAEGRHPIDMARSLNKRVEGIGIVRSRRLARTEVIAAHAEATLNGYAEAGVEGVEVEAEFAHAGDSKVCAKCRELAERDPVPIEEARGMIPVHPNCRCAWLPVIDDDSASGIVLA